MALPRVHASEVVFLAGAGISIPSGIASGQMFNDRLLAEIVPTDDFDFDLEPIRRWQKGTSRRPLIRFEQLIAILRDWVDPGLSILGYLETSWTPTATHLFLAESVRQGARLLTTNLDALCELAFVRDGADLPRQVADVDDWVAAMLGTPVQSVFKIHGTLRRADFLQAHVGGQAHSTAGRAIETAAVTLDAIGALTPTPATFTGGFLLPEYVTSVLRDVLSGRDLVVLGYSGSDDFDVMPSLRALRAVYRRVIWIDHRDVSRVTVRRLGNFQFIRGPTNDVLQQIFDTRVPEAPAYGREAAPRLVEFLQAWSAELGVDDTRRRLVCGEILHQSGFPWQAKAIWKEALQRLPESGAESARVALRIGQTCLAGFDIAGAMEHFSRAADTFEQLRDSIGVAESHVGRAAATWFRAVADGTSPDPTLTELANVMPQILAARDEVERRRFQLDWPEPELRRLFSDQRRLEQALMRGAITLSRIARDHSLLLSEDLVHDVTSVTATVPELLEQFGLFPAIPEDKLLYLDYLAELSIAAFIPYPDDFSPRYNELRQLCRLLRIPYRMATYYLDLGNVMENGDRETAAMLYAKARRFFEKARHRDGVIVAARSEAAMKGLSPDAAEMRIRFETTGDEDGWFSG